MSPVILPENGTVIAEGTSLSIVMSCASTADGAVIRYTTDGSEPTAESPVFGRFRVNGKTTVKAAAFYPNGNRSEITVAESFTGSKTRVEISCATTGAVVRYTTDGSAPGAESAVYAGAFDVTASCSIRAAATLDDWLDSEVAARTVAKVWGIGDTMGEPDRVFTTAGDAGFVCAAGEGPAGGEAMRSENPGSAARDGEYKRAVLSTTVTWTYLKDWFDMEPYENGAADCLWVCAFEWENDFMKAVRGWYGADLTREQIAAKAKEMAANGVNTVEEAYVIGFDPRDAGKRFLAGIEMGSDGNVTVTWNPDLNEGGKKQERVYRVWGREKLEEGTWEDVTDKPRDGMRFFKVTVEMP